MPKNKELINAQPILDEIAEQDNALIPYLQGKTYDKERIIEETKEWCQTHVRSAFEIGCRLIVLKARCEHGEFGELIKNEFFMSNRYAQFQMSLARVVVELNKKSGGKIGWKNLQSFDQRKIVLLGEIIPESEEELEQLGTIGGRTVEEYDLMSRKELTAMVKKQRQQIDEGIAKVKDLKEQVHDEKEKREAMFKKSENTVTEACTRFLNEIHDAVDTFDRTCQYDGPESDFSPSTKLRIISTRTEARCIYEVINSIIKERFPEVLEEEVPDDLDLSDGIILDSTKN